MKITNLKFEQMEDNMVVNTNEASVEMHQILDWSYEMALNGLPTLGSAIDLAHDYENEKGTLEDKVNSLIRWQISKMATSGFLAGSGELVNLPLAIPNEISSTVFIQIRMILAIAYMGGYDIKNDKVKTLVYFCLVADSAKNIMIDVGVQIGQKFGHNLLEGLSGKVLAKINKMVGLHLETKFETKAPILFVKVVSVFSGIVGGSINAIMTNSIGNIARDTFINSKSFNLLTDQLIDYENIQENIELLKFYSYLNIVKVDGVIKQEEYELFDNMINHSMLDDNTKMRLIQKLNSKETDVIDYSQFLSYPEQSLDLIKNLILIAKCDNEFHITEKMFIKNVGKQIGYSEIEIEKLISESRYQIV